MATLYSEQALASNLYKILSTSASPGTINRLRLEIDELGGRVSDELLLFRALMKVCRNDEPLDMAFEKAGLGRISKFEILNPDPERGRVVQAFTTMYELHLKEGTGRRERFKKQNTRDLTSIKMASEGMGSPMRVHVHAGRQLVVSDLFSSDPYCVLTYTDPQYEQVQRQKTEVVKRSLNPVWKTAMDFKSVSQGGRLEIEVWDHDTIGQDDFMGKVVVDLSGVDFKTGEHKWVKLEGVQSGELRVRLSFPEK